MAETGNETPEAGEQPRRRSSAAPPEPDPVPEPESAPAPVGEPQPSGFGVLGWLIAGFLIFVTVGGVCSFVAIVGG